VGKDRVAQGQAKTSNTIMAKEAVATMEEHSGELQQVRTSIEQYQSQRLLSL